MVEENAVVPGKKLPFVVELSPPRAPSVALDPGVMSPALYGGAVIVVLVVEPVVEFPVPRPFRRYLLRDMEESWDIPLQYC